MQGNLSIKEAIGEYKDIYLAYRNFATRTREEYVNDLEDLAKFLEGKGIRSVGKVTLSQLVRYMAELDRRGYAGSTRKRKTISIKSFFSFLYTEGYTITNIGKQLIPPLVELHIPRYLTTDEYKTLLKSAKSKKRDYAIIQLLLQTGIKLSELTRLTLNDLHFTTSFGTTAGGVGSIRIIGNQRNSERVIPLNTKASLAIKEYFSIRQKSSDQNIFLNRAGKGLGKRGIEKIICKYLEASGINNASVNSLRHTFGVHQIKIGTRIAAIQKFMGHKVARSTSKYTSLVRKLTHML